jgi:hypothetical protein
VEQPAGEEEDFLVLPGETLAKYRGGPPINEPDELDEEPQKTSTFEAEEANATKEPVAAVVEPEPPAAEFLAEPVELEAEISVDTIAPIDDAELPGRDLSLDLSLDRKEAAFE